MRTTSNYSFKVRESADAADITSAETNWDDIDTLLETKVEKSITIDSNLLAANWVGSDAPFSYSLTVSGVTTVSNQELLPSTTITIDELTAFQSANIIDGGQATNTIILKAFGTKPEINIPIRIFKRGD